MSKKTNTTDLEFVKAWQASESLDDVAKRLGAKRSAVQARGARMRMRGVKLKRFPPGRRPGVDVDALNKLCERTANA